MTRKEWFQNLTLGSAYVLSAATTVAALVFGGIEAHSESEMHKTNDRWRALHHYEKSEHNYYNY